MTHLDNSNVRRKGWVYVIIAESLQAVKVGFTSCRDVTKRVRDLQTGCPAKLTLIGKCWTTQDQEKVLRDAMRDYRIRGEWFDLNGLPVSTLVKGLLDDPVVAGIA